MKQFRAAGVRTPIMVSAAAAQIDLRVRCLGLSADDFLTKPYDNRELVAHVKAVVRRANGHAQSEIRIGQLVVNLDTQSASVADMPLPLTRKEYCVLELLSLRKGIVVTKEAFLNHLYGGMDEPGVEDHRRLCLQAAAKAGRGHRRPSLHQDRARPRLRHVRSGTRIGRHPLREREGSRSAPRGRC